jgi:hypothetical protein
VAKPSNLITVESYAEPTAKMLITVDYQTERGPSAHEPVVMRSTTGCLKTIGESPCGE